jgi:hypothetical protein
MLGNCKYKMIATEYATAVEDAEASLSFKQYKVRFAGQCRLDMFVRSRFCELAAMFLALEHC